MPRSQPPEVLIPTSQKRPLRLMQAKQLAGSLSREMGGQAHAVVGGQTRKPMGCHGVRSPMDTQQHCSGLISSCPMRAAGARELRRVTGNVTHWRCLDHQEGHSQFLSDFLGDAVSGHRDYS